MFEVYAMWLKIPRFLKRMVIAALLFCGVLLGHMTAQAAVLPDDVYLIQMAESDMTFAATSDAKGSRLVLWPYRPTATWLFRHQGNDVYKISTNSSVLDLREGKNVPGVPIIIWNWNGGKNQLWKVKRVGPYYALISMQTGQAVDLVGNRRVKDNKFQGAAYTGSMGQLFQLTRPGGKPIKPSKGNEPAAEPAKKPRYY